MKIFKILPLMFLGTAAQAQLVTLTADGPGDTYELINSVLAPGYNVIETPDCAHPEFGRHIEEVWDNDLNKYVFKFHIHVEPDNDRCIKFDRQRNEIKTYNQSPAHLIGTYGETVTYTWKFKLDSGFKASNKFTHIHQIKAYGGPHESIPVFSLIPRKSGSNEKLQVMHSDSIASVEIASAPLSNFKGTWVEVTETIKYAENGTYSISIKRVSDNSVLLSYNNPNIRTWREDADGIRPKWGIYRSLLSPEMIRDEQVLFADFSIQEVTLTTLQHELPEPAGETLFFPNPVNDNLHLGTKQKWDTITVIDMQGKVIMEKKNLKTGVLNVSSLKAGTYIIQLKSEKRNVSSKFIKQ
ncbi:T9SS type A sorting domain-containing protein [Flavobacterium sp. MK4S-17]|uniref:T9SS type A sorting domain-containing protein n=1 Tax=Flavobacterium sp. MK4S-17 TaxID=2543737 RepID=UPI001358165C|nr:T9SS type A sorting domain-containing protein [Flavobacterium sp. MK4S-17]